MLYHTYEYQPQSKTKIAIILGSSLLPYSYLSTCTAFISPSKRSIPSISRQNSLATLKQPVQLYPILRSSYTTSLYASSSSTPNKSKPPPLPKVDDPYLLLGLDSRNPTTDKKEIKRAYRKRAMQYHPDVITTPESTKKEREEASKDFARINAAYEMLTGGNKGSVVTESSSSTKSSSGGYNYQPPHRRTSDYSSSSYGKSTNWEDFMPNYNDDEDAKYDAGGDSFGSIFSDILTGAAGYAAGYSSGGSGGIVGDFIDFLEGNIDGFESGYNDDDNLLLYGSFEEVASEMDETDILVTSLETKLSTVENELMQVQADLNGAIKFSEKLDLEERIAELKAREKVVRGYLKKGKKRLIKLRERYKQLMVEGRGGRGYNNSSSSSRDTTTRDSSSTSSSSGRTSTSNTYSKSQEPPAQSPSSASTSTSSSASSSSSANWRNEGFSSSYGRRSSGSRRSSRRDRSTANNRDDSTVRKEYQQPQQQKKSSSQNDRSTSGGGSGSRTGSSSNTKAAPLQYEPWVPPHRRTTSSTEQAAQDKKRLRELKVDDDFERLKKEMGM
jgi:hypothetical protein